MDTTQLFQFVDQVHTYFMKQCPDPEKEMLYRHLKLSEEFGELSSDIMSYLGHQRQEKLNERNSENLGHEVADVVIAALLTAKMANVDLTQAFEYKINKVKQRFGLE